MSDSTLIPFPQLISTALSQAVDQLGAPEGFVAQVSPTADAKFGDYQTNAAMMLKKTLGKNPREIATQIVELIDGGDLFEKPDIAGPGFINFKLKPSAYSERLLALLADPKLGVPQVEKPKKIVIDFSAPNVAKPMHVGHIRSTIIGDCLARIGKFLGHEVISDNHIGDWGTQFGMILYGWKNLLDEAALETEPVEELVRVYKQVNAMQKEDDSLRDVCKAELVKLQAGDEENLAIWERCVEMSKTGLKKIYAKLDIEFDHWLGESFYNDALAPIVDGMIENGIARESDGAIAVFSDGSVDPKDDPFLSQRDGEWGAQPFLVRKADGGFGYAASDLATIDHRANVFGADEAWYVVGSPQQLHFDQLFATEARRGGTIALEFIPFGSILGKDRKMLRTREGETVQLADVLAEAVQRAAAIVDEKSANLPDEERAEIARLIGVGSVKYSELSQHRMTDYIFDWDTMLALKGNTAPYLINAYVRSRAIFRKLGENVEATFDQPVEIVAEGERALIAKLAQFGEVLPDTLNDFRPNTLAQYLYDVASQYHRFWEACPVLTSEGVTRQTRIALCELTSRVLHTGLGLMGISVPERM
ncbi:MAG: arginyl-tRNA synthetase [Pseudoalteromonas tetraodonis]|jgi:arginyl-tRNA synthetase